MEFVVELIPTCCAVVGLTRPIDLPRGRQRGPRMLNGVGKRPVARNPDRDRTQTAVTISGTTDFLGKTIVKVQARTGR